MTPADLRPSYDEQKRREDVDMMVASSSLQVTCRILDGVAIVNMLRQGSVKTFEGYASGVFLPYISAQLQQVTRLETTKQIFSTHNKNVLCTNHQQDISSLSPCTHEEADTWIFLHLEDAIRQGHNLVSIHTVDTDVVVLQIAAACTSAQYQRVVDCFWSWEGFRYIADSLSTWSRSMYCITCISCLHRV